MADVLARAMSADELAVLERPPSGLLIGGEWREAASRATFAVEDEEYLETRYAAFSLDDAGAAQ